MTNTLNTNREIKFRAWDLEHKKWVMPKGANMAFPYAISPDKPWDPALALFGFGVDPRTHWMQYIDLKDKNDREIYEGDILHTYFPANGGSYTGCVVWGDGGWTYDISSINGYLSSEITSCSEVIGNIHENPEFLNNDN